MPNTPKDSTNRKSYLAERRQFIYLSEDKRAELVGKNLIHLCAADHVSHEESFIYHFNEHLGADVEDKILRELK